MIKTKEDISNRDILDVFNSINKKIQLTIEEPKEGILPFLDIDFAIKHDGIRYKWYQKSFHSKNLVNRSSFISYRTKMNFICSRYREIMKRNNHKKRDEPIIN